MAEEADPRPAEGIAAGVLIALDLVGYGCVLLDDQRRVIAKNERARCHFGEALALRDDRLLARDGMSNETLSCLLKRVAKPDAHVGPVLLRHRNAPALIAYATRCSGLEATLLVLIDEDERREPSPDILRQLYDLTAAEARIALELLRGRGLKDIAAAQRVVEGTVRSQIKAIFAKTNTHRQAELVALLAGIAHVNLCPKPSELRSPVAIAPNVRDR